MTRILLGQLGSNGDCLYTTAIARQIKQDFPDCHLTWAISSLCRKVLDHNPDVDEVWEIPLSDWSDMDHTWTLFESEAHRLGDAGLFDQLFLTQISPSHYDNFDGTIRPSIFRGYRNPITVPVEVTIRLTNEEKESVDRWFSASPAADASSVVLFECSSKSGQSFMTSGLATEIAEFVTRERQKAVVIISTHERITSSHPRIITAESLSMRETAWLTHYVDLFVGCGSGLTVVATSTSAKPALPNIQILKRERSVFASFRHDFSYFNKPTAQFMEITEEDPLLIGRAIVASLSDGFEFAQATYDDPVPINFDSYQELIEQMLIDRGKYVDAAHSLLVTAERYGWHASLHQFGRYCVAPFLDDDPRARLPHRRHEIEQFRAALAGPPAHVPVVKPRRKPINAPPPVSMTATPLGLIDLMPRMKMTASARRRGRTVIVEPSAPRGHFLYGPYLPLAEGTYRVILDVQASELRDEAAPLISVDVTPVGGPSLMMREYGIGDFTDGRLRFVFTVPDAYCDTSLGDHPFEIRLSNLGNGGLKVSGMTLANARWPLDLLPYMKLSKFAKREGSTVLVDSINSKGIFISGPYLALLPGIYQLTANLEVSEAGNTATRIVGIDVTPVGRKSAHSSTYRAGELADGTLEIAFNVPPAWTDRPSDEHPIEIRFKKLNRGRIALRGLRLSQTSVS